MSSNTTSRMYRTPDRALKSLPTRAGLRSQKDSNIAEIVNELFSDSPGLAMDIPDLDLARWDKMGSPIGMGSVARGKENEQDLVEELDLMSRRAAGGASTGGLGGLTASSSLASLKEAPPHITPSSRTMASSSLTSSQDAMRLRRPTPPSAGSAYSHLSQASSSRNGGMTENSTLASSVLAATPPSDGNASIARGSGSSASLSNGSSELPKRSYATDAALLGSKRDFRRHVSAPLHRQETPSEDMLERQALGKSSSAVDHALEVLEEERKEDASASRSTDNSSFATATMTARPALPHTVSTESQRDYATPASGARILGSSLTHGTGGATTRRLVGGLSRFGGPARRRGQVPTEPENEQRETKSQSPIASLMATPPKESLPPAPRRNSIAVSPSAERERPRLSPRRYSPLMPPTIMEDVPGSSNAMRASQSTRMLRSEVEMLDGLSLAKHRHSPSAPESSRNAVMQQSYEPPPQPLHHSMPVPLAPPPLPTYDLSAQRIAPAPPPPPPPQPAPPTARKSFNVNGVDYERLGILGKGGSSKVYSVLDPQKRVVLALKRVALDRADPDTLQSYTNEIELLLRLRGHERIIQLLEHQITFSQSGRPKMLQMLMECGETDFAVLLDEQRGKPLNMNFVGMYWQQMLQAVHAVHQQNVVHTDLKPANFVMVKGRLKIIDFGIAKAIANDTVNIHRDQQVGTVNYISPEAVQRMNNQKVFKLSFPADVWSLGCILYQMIYGGPPFQHVTGGPLVKMNIIGSASHQITYPDRVVAKYQIGPDGRTVEGEGCTVPVRRAAIDAMRACLQYDRDKRLTIPQLLEHEFFKGDASDATSITQAQMKLLIDHILKSATRLKADPNGTEEAAAELFAELKDQNMR